MSGVLITGCGGFVGRALVQRLVSEGHDVWGVDREPQNDFAGSEHTTGDLTDVEVVRELLERSEPDAVVHLAALSSVRESFEYPTETILQNTASTLHLLNAIRLRGKKTRMLAVGSADEYGVVDIESLPLTEVSPASPVSPYALSKTIQNQCCRSYAELYEVDVVITRSFNHTGAGQRDTFVLPSFARQVVEIKLGRRDPVMSVGNLEARREFLDIEDVCDAYVALLRDGKPGETYNVCSGESHHLRSLLEKLFQMAGVDVEVQLDPKLLRPVDVPDLRGDPTKIREHTGWRAKTTIDETLQSLLDYWEACIGSNGNTHTGGSE